MLAPPYSFAVLGLAAAARGAEPTNTRRRKEEVKASALSMWRIDREKDRESAETLRLPNSVLRRSGALLTASGESNSR